MPHNNDKKLVIFQDEMHKAASADDNDESDPSLVFFELANAETVAYRLQRPHSNEDDNDNKHDNDNEASQDVLVTIQQNSQAQTHTGGVVWETSYLLLGYLLAQQQQQQQHRSLGRVVVEVGAGCGLLGIGLAVAGLAVERVVVTEVDLVMPLLQANVERNVSLLLSQQQQQQQQDGPSLVAHQLDWTNFQPDAATAGIAPHSVDTIVGTDVVFTTSLVQPLWQTLHYLSHDRTVIYLCVQIRCAAAHELLLQTAGQHGFVLQRIDNGNHQQGEDSQVQLLPTWAAQMECFLFCITRTKEAAKRKTKRHKPSSTSKRSKTK